VCVWFLQEWTCAYQSGRDVFTWFTGIADCINAEHSTRVRRTRHYISHEVQTMTLHRTSVIYTPCQALRTLHSLFKFLVTLMSVM
jgi:hypothetical protein